MNGFRIGLTLASVAALGACSADASKVIIANPGPLAYIRFINAIPDSGTQDWRFVDAVEGSPNVMALTFRGIFPGASYQSATPGSRHLKVFQSSLDPTFADPTKATPEIVSTVFIDSTFTLTAGTHYTIIAIGNLRAPKTAKFLILTDNYTDPAANVAVRVVNASSTVVRRLWIANRRHVGASKLSDGFGARRLYRLALVERDARCARVARKRNRIEDTACSDRRTGARRRRG